MPASLIKPLRVLLCFRCGLCAPKRARGTRRWYKGHKKRRYSFSYAKHYESKRLV